MGQIVQSTKNPIRCNLAAIQAGGSQADTVLNDGEVWFVDTTNAEKGTNGYGYYDAYIVGDGTNKARVLDVKQIDDMSAFATKQELATKQDVINDLATIRGGAQKGNTAYQKPNSGISKSDLAQAVQTSLGKADAAAPQATTYTKTEVDALLQNVDIDVDSALSATSENPVQNKIIKTALDGKADKEDTYTKEQLNSLITTPAVKYVTVGTISDLPATGSADTIYRVANYDGEQVATNKYVEYAWDGSAYVLLDVKKYGIDDEPTAGSHNLVESGGVYDAIAAKSEMPLVDEDGFHVIDEDFNVGMKYDENGLDVAKVSSHFVDVLKAAGVSDDDVMTSHAAEVNEDGFFIVDENLDVGVRVDSGGVHAKNILEYKIIED